MSFIYLKTSTYQKYRNYERLELYLSMFFRETEPITNRINKKWFTIKTDARIMGLTSPNLQHGWMGGDSGEPMVHTKPGGWKAACWRTGLAWEGQSFILLMPSTNWVKPTHIRDSDPLYLASPNLMWISSINTLQFNTQNQPSQQHTIYKEVQFSCSVVSDSLWSHGLQHTRLPCPSSIPGAYSNSCPLSQWYHPTILSSVVPFSSCLQAFPASGSFPVSQFFTSGGQSLGVSASASFLPMNTQDWLSLGLPGLISLQSKGLSSLLQHHSSKSPILWHSAFFMVQLSYPYMTAGKAIALTRWTFVGKVLCLLFNMLDDYRKEEINVSRPEASPGDSCKIDDLLLHPLTSSPSVL